MNRPYVLPVHDLHRQAGSHREYTRTVEAPDRLGTDVIGVPAGEPIELGLRLESVMDGIYVSGTATARVTGECARCLDPIEEEIEAEIAELFLYPEAVARAREDGDEEAEELPRTDGETLDLEEVVRDSIVADLPYSPLCDPDCEGLCPECGVRLADAEEGHAHESIDPRLAVLRGLLGDE